MKLNKNWIALVLVSALTACPGQVKKHSVIVNTVPHSANVYINNKFFAKTPCGFNAPDNYGLAVEIRLDGYSTWRQTYTVRDEIQINISLNRLSGQQTNLSEYPVQFTTIPSDASLLIDGQVRGVTPYEGILPAGVQFQLILRKEGYQDWRETLTINDEIRKTIKLQKKSGSSRTVWMIAGTALISYGLVQYFTSDIVTAPETSSDLWPAPPGRPN